MGLLDTVSKVGNAASGLFNIGSTLIQNNAQKKAQAREFRNNKEMWNLANQYNTPEMQMSRLRDAGLNPHLVYGNGSVTGNTSTQTPKYQAPQLQRMPLENISPLEILSTFADLKQKSAMADKAQSESTWIDKQIATDLIGKIHTNKMQEDITGRNFQWNPKMGANIGRTELGGDSKNLYLEKYSSEARKAKNEAELKQLDIDFYKTIPKQYQWLFTIARQFLGK